MLNRASPDDFSSVTTLMTKAVFPVARERGINVAMIAVPAAAAQSVADTLVEAGVRSLLNFADVRLRLPPDVYVEHIDIGVTLEKVAFFARRPAGVEREAGSP